MKASEVVRNVVKDKLARGEVVASMTVRLTRGVEIARLAKTAGFDMLYVDLEHSTISLDAAIGIVTMIGIHVAGFGTASKRR